LDRADQSQQAVGDEVVLVHVRGQAAAKAARDVLDERRVGEDQAVADALILALAVLAPELLRLVLAQAQKLRLRVAVSSYCVVRASEARAPGRPPPQPGRRDRDCC